MELDDLKKSWEARDRKLDAALRLNRRLAASRSLDRAESRLSRLSKLLWGEVALDGALLGSVGTPLEPERPQHQSLDEGTYARMARVASPYGDGHAAERIISLLRRKRQESVA